MIDIDIAGQLFPNPITMLVQLCSVAVLFLVARHFLWPSFKKWTDARSNQMQDDLAQSEKAKNEALADRQTALAQLNEASSKANDIVEAAVKEARSEKADILAQAQKEAQAEKKKAHEQIEAERASMYKDLQNEMVNVAMEAAGKLLGEKNADQMDRDAIEAFVKDAGND